MMTLAFQNRKEVPMAEQRQIEIFSAGCAVCEEAAALVRNIACPSCTVTVRDMGDPAVAARAAELGIGTVPAVVVDGMLAACCIGKVSADTLRAAGVGRPLA
jgi:hypothetical protein